MVCLLELWFHHGVSGLGAYQLNIVPLIEYALLMYRGILKNLQTGRRIRRKLICSFERNVHPLIIGTIMYWTMSDRYPYETFRHGGYVGDGDEAHEATSRANLYK